MFGYTKDDLLFMGGVTILIMLAILVLCLFTNIKGPALKMANERIREQMLSQSKNEEKDSPEDNTQGTFTQTFF